MKNSGKFMIAAISVGTLTLLGFLGYRKMSSDKKINKSEEDDDKASVELGKTKSVDDISDLDSVLVSSKKEVYGIYKEVLLSTILRDKSGKYYKLYEITDVLIEFTVIVSRGFLLNLEVIEMLPKDEGEFIKLLYRIRLIKEVSLLLNENRLRRIYGNQEGQERVVVSVPSKKRRPRNLIKKKREYLVLNLQTRPEGVGQREISKNFI